jgi:outer membrane protein W
MNVAKLVPVCITVLAALLAARGAVAVEQGDWLVRARLAAVVPQDDSGAVSVGGAAIAGSGVSVDDGSTLDLDFTHMSTTWTRW